MVDGPPEVFHDLATVGDADQVSDSVQDFELHARVVVDERAIRAVMVQHFFVSER